MFKHVRMHDAILKFYQRSQPVAFSNAETLYDDLVLLRDQILMYGDLSEAQTNYLNEFIEKFDTTLSSSVRDIFEKWLDDGFLIDFLRGIINEEVVEARDGRPSLNLRLNRDIQANEAKINLLKERDNQLTNELAEKADQSFVDAQFSNIISGTPKGTYTSLSALQSAYPTGSDGIFLVTQNGHWYYWNSDSSAWEDGGVYQATEIGIGEITSENIKDNSLTGFDMNFLAHDGNLLNLDNVVTGGYYNKDGEWNTNANYSTVLIYTDAGNYITNLEQYFEIAFWDEAGEVLTGGYASGGWSGTFVAPPNTYKLSLAFLKDNYYLLDKMVFKGNKLPKEYIAYEGFTLSEKIKSSNLADVVVEPKHTTFLNPSENLFDESKIIEGGYYNTLGQWNANTNYRAVIIEANAGNYITNIGQPYEIAFWDETGSTLESSYTSGSWHGQLVAPSNTVKFSLAFRNTKDISQAMVVKGDTLPLNYISNSQFTLSDVIQLKTDVATTGKVGLYFGDSITETATMDDTGDNYNPQFTTNWPSHMSELRLSSFKNYARSGATYRDQGNITTDIRRNVRNQVNLALSNNEEADLIVVSLGTNDGTANLGDYDTAMSKSSKSSLDTSLTIESARWTFWTLRENFPNAVMYCALPIQRASYEQPMELIDGIRKMAERYNFIIIDATFESGIVRDFEVASGTGRYLRDGLHPNDAGKKLMGKFYSRVIANTFR